MSYITIDTCQARINELTNRLTVLNTRYNLDIVQRDADLKIILGDTWANLSPSTQLATALDAYNYVLELDNLDKLIIRYIEEGNELQARINVLKSQ